MNLSVKILVVDDEEEMRTLLRSRLTRENPRFEVDTVSGAEECIEYVRSNKVDCIISDFQMGGKDGVSLLRALRDSGDNTPFIFFTGQGNEEIAREAFKAGADDYFSKDLMGFAKFARLANSVEQAVKQRLVDEYRIQAEKELALEKQKLEDILFNLGVGLSIQDRDFRVIYQNRIIEGMGGVAIGKRCYEVYENRDTKCEDCPVKKTFKDGKSHSAIRCVEKFGGELWVELTTTPITDASGNITSCIEVVKDLSEIKSHEKALMQSELRFRKLFEGANDAIFLADTETGEILDANQMAAEMLGRSRESIIGMHQSELHPPDELDKAREIFNSHVNSPGAVFTGIGLQRTDGSVLPVEISSSTFELGGRKVIQGIFRDISERVKAEEEIRESEARYREAEQIASIGRWEWDIAGDKVRWSDGMFNIFGLDPSGFGKTYQSYLDFIVPDDVERVKGMVAESLKGEKPLDYTTRFTRRDGEERDLYVFGRATLAPDGSPVRLFGTAQDITDLKMFERSLQWELSLNRALSGLSTWLIDRTSTIEDMANVTLEFARAMTGSRHGFVSSLEQTDESTALVITSMTGNECGIDDRERRVEMMARGDGGFDSLCGEVLNTGKPFYTNSPASHELSKGVPEGHIGIDNFLAVPAMIGDDMLGMIALANSKNGYTDDDLNVVSKLAEFYSLALERMNAEDEVRKNEVLLKAVLTALPDMVFIHEEDGTILKAFHPGEARLYAPEEKFIGSPLAEVFPPDVAEGAVDAIRRTLETGTTQVYEYRLDMPDGGGIFEARLVPFGKDRVLSVVRDITISRKAVRALRNSENRFRQLADNIDGALWMTSADRKTVHFAGRGYKDIWGVDPVEKVWDFEAWFGSIHPEDRPRVDELIRNTPIEKSYKHEYRIVRPDGGVRWIRDRAFPILDEKGEIHLLAGIADDITEERSLQKQREDLFSMVRHDVRTPLTIIAGNAELLADEKHGALDNESLEMLRSIQNNAKNLSRMLDDLAAISKLEAGTMPIRITDTDAVELVLEVSANMSGTAGQKGLELTKQLDDDLPVLRVDRSNILRALTNMVQNAVNYTPEGGKIVIGAHRCLLNGSSAVEFTIQDNGAGLPPDDHAKVFEKRFRGANSSGINGSGLGLAIVKLVAEAHGGTVELDSAPGSGSTFRLTIPA